MQMYSGLPIITNKVTIEEQKGIPHHLLGLIALDEEPWRVGQFKRKASQIIQEIRSRGRLPILVGGTHYYTQSLLFEDSLVSEGDGIVQGQGELSLQEIAEKFPILEGPHEAILKRLKEVDPIMAERWHPNETRKIRRSLEIYLSTGRRASDIYAEQQENRTRDKEAHASLEGVTAPKSENSAASSFIFWVHSESEPLKKRLDDRVDRMLNSGLLDEVTSMSQVLRKMETGDLTVDRSRGIWVSIGFKEFEPYIAALARGDESTKSIEQLLSLSIEQTKAATRQYAKGQVRWIRLKLLPALSNQHSLDNLFLLDGTDITQWKTGVSDPATMLTRQFLDGEQLPPPVSLSDAAKQHLTLERSDPFVISVRNECDLCHTVTVTEDTWLAHLKSRTHRRMVKKSLQTARKGRQSLPESADFIAPLDAT